MLTNIDVTLRDGGYRNNFFFPMNYALAHAKSSIRAGLKWVEIAYRNGSFASIRDIGLTGRGDDDYIQAVADEIGPGRVCLIAHPKNINEDDLRSVYDAGARLIRICIDPRSPRHASVADTLDSLSIPGVLAGIAPRVPGVTVVGPAFTVRYRRVEGRSGFRNAANYLDDVPPGSVVVVDNGGSLECTNWGSLLTITAGIRGVAGTVVHGSARDVREIIDLGYPLFSTGVTMFSGKNRVELDRTQVPLEIHGTAVAPGDVIFADDNGALCIPLERVSEVVGRAEQVQQTEAGICRAVRGGCRLDIARSMFRYDQPWIDSSATGRAQL